LGIVYRDGNLKAAAMTQPLRKPQETNAPNKRNLLDGVDEVSQMKRAYRLIKAGYKGEAYEVLAPILAQQPNNVDCWWLAAFAAPTPQKAVFACQKVLSLKPDHYPAQQFLAEQQRVLNLSSLGQTSIDPARPVALKKAQYQRRGPRLWQILLLLVIPVLIIAGILTAINITGSSFGLPLGGLFSASSQLPPARIIVGGFESLSGSIAGIGEGNDDAIIRMSSLVVGAQHSYFFDAPGPSTVMINVVFNLAGGKAADRAVGLYDANGKILLYSNPKDGINNITYNLNLPGNNKYEIRLAGVAGVTQGPYQMAIAFFPLVN
jgi:hypothetical protein